MSHSNQATFPRRTFLKGSAGVLAAGSIGIPLARAMGGPPFTIAYWDGSNLIPTYDIRPAPFEAQGLQVTLHGYGEGSLRGIESLFNVPWGNGFQTFRFMSWTSDGCAQTHYFQPLDGDFAFNVRTWDGNSEISHPYSLTLLPNDAPLLALGTYVLADGFQNLGGYRLELGRLDGPLRALDGAPAPFQYMLMHLSL